MTPAEHDILLVHAYLDGELDPAHALEIERRIAAEPALRAEHDRVAALRRALRETLPHEPVPPGLRTRIEAAAGLRRPQPSWPALAASVALAAMLGSGATWIALRALAPDASSDAVVAAHMRALMAPQPIDVASSDRHVVKPWFAGRIPQAPRVVDLAQQGFPLVGGRIDVIGRTPVPTLVYRHRQHLISLIAVPAGTAPGGRTLDGYSVVTWAEAGVGYWAISDLGAADLDKFATAFRTAPPDR